MLNTTDLGNLSFNSPAVNNSCSWWHCSDDNYYVDLSLVLVKGFFLSCVVVLTIGGNTLVLLAVLISHSLRTSTHYLIVNLAAADLLLGVAVLPFSAVLELSGSWLFGSVFCEVWTAVDVLCCTASIWSLCVISIDRYIGVTRPLGYSRIVTERRVGALMLGVWTLSAAVSISPLFGWQPTHSDPYVCTVNQELGYVLFSVIISFYLPAFCIIILYWKIYQAACRQGHSLDSGSKTVTLRIRTGEGLNERSSESIHTTVRVNRGGSLPNSTHNLTVVSTSEAPRRPSDNCERIFSRRMRKDSYRMSHLDVYSTQCHASSKRSSVSTSRRNSSRIDVSQESSCSNSPERRVGLVPGKFIKFRRQQKAAKTLGIVVGVFLLCWFPFFFMLPLSKYNSTLVRTVIQ